jgi:hypothetical protein
MKKNISLLLSTSMLLIVLSACTIGSTSTARSENAAATQVDTSQTLGDFQPIPGTTYLYAQVSKGPNTGRGIGNLISSLSSSEDYRSASNLVFLDSKTLSSLKLFDANDKIILSVSQYPDPNAGTTAPAGQIQPAQPAQSALPALVAQPTQPAAPTHDNAVQWLVYQVIQKDPNQPSAPTTDLPFSIAVSDASGSNYQEVLTNLTGLYGMNMVDPGHLLVVYTRDNIKSASILDLAKRTIVTTNPIVDLGAGVK